MAMRKIYVILLSARELSNVNHLSKIKPYAVVSIRRDSHRYAAIESPEDLENGTNPIWEYNITLWVEEAALLGGRLELNVEIFTKGTLGVTKKEIGSVSMRLDASTAAVAEYPVFKHSRRPKGILTMYVEIGERVCGSWYPPPFYGYPQQLYGYPSQGYALQGHLPQIQHYTPLQECVWKMVIEILIQLTIGSVVQVLGNLG